MSKKRQISYLREKIMCDIEKIIVLLDIITSYRAETLKESVVLSDLALAKARQIGRNNEKIGKLLMNKKFVKN